MAEFLRRHALLFTSTALLISSFQLMSVSIANREIPRFGAQLIDSALVPLQIATHEIAESARYTWRRYIWLLDVEEERNSLRDRIKELEAHNSRLMEYVNENDRLRQLLQYTEQTGQFGVAASVVGRDPSNWVKTITINRGRVDGIRPGLAVVDGNAIIGQTTAVSERSSKVLLLTDHTSAIDAIVQSSRAVGIVEGGPKDLLTLRYVEKRKDITVRGGDRVIASGLDGVYPKGTLIGVVYKVNASSSGMFQDIEVQPSVNLNRLENVLVIVPGKINVKPGGQGSD